MYQTTGLPPVKFYFPPGFASGVCMSWYPTFLKMGAVYRDREGRERDLLDIMTQDYGIDTLCLQVFMGDASNVPWCGGGIDAPYCLKLAKQAHARGMRIMLSLILGSGWNNAGIQTKPVGWYGLSFDALTRALHDYVYDTTRLFVDAGVTPEWIKIGNEANMGILLPEGSTARYDRLAALYTAGHEAVKKADPGIRTMVHLANCEVTQYMLEYFAALDANHCQYDMPALSFYPYSANPSIPNVYEALRATLCSLTDATGKPLMIVECGFDNAMPDAGYEEFMKMLRILSEAPESAQGGIIYWEPEMIRRLYGHYPYNAWQNDGKPSRVMDAYLAIEKRSAARR